MPDRFFLPTRIISGCGTISRLGTEAKKLGNRALLVTGRNSSRRTGLLDRVSHDLEDNDVKLLLFDRVEPNPRATTVDAGAELARREGADLIIGMGGGSAMDAAKCINLANASHKSISHYLSGASRIRTAEPLLPLVLVPTVAASGSEANEGAVITDWESHQKVVVFSSLLFPTLSIVDPELTLSLPRKATAQGGVDIFCHVVESYLTTDNPSPLTDGIMETVMRMAVENLPRALEKPDDIDARNSLSQASTLACSQFVDLGGGAGTMTLHGIEHPLSGYYDIAHGDGLAALLPAWMASFFAERRERFASLGRNVFHQTDGIAAVEDWLNKVGMKLRLQELGIEQERLDEVADCAVRTAPWLANHPTRLDAPAVARIYRQSY